MFRKIAGLACAMALLLALFTLPAARTALAGDNDAAKIGDKTYETLEKAFAEVPDGTPTTITLLRDAWGNGIQVAGTKNITLDLGGFTYTIDGDAVGSSGTETNGFQLLKGAHRQVPKRHHHQHQGQDPHSELLRPDAAECPCWTVHSSITLPPIP